MKDQADCNLINRMGPQFHFLLVLFFSSSSSPK